MTITASTGQLSAQPTKAADPKVLSTTFGIASGSATHVAIDISETSQLAVTLLKFGVLSTEYLELHVSVDGGVNFRLVKTYTTAQLNQANGLYDLVPVKGTHARVYGYNTQVGIGVNVRLYA